jgi:hypothetical protein
VHGIACLDSGATLFLLRSIFNPSLIEPMKATANIHGYDANMTMVRIQPRFVDRGTAYISRSFTRNLLFVGDYGS